MKFRTVLFQQFLTPWSSELGDWSWVELFCGGNRFGNGKESRVRWKDTNAQLGSTGGGGHSDGPMKSVAPRLEKRNVPKPRRSLTSGTYGNCLRIQREKRHITG
ncbi:hypothetical protein NPIL_628271 [Nephila pilipes]|uniref:Uncharacterized protein n=1 Tax=Nephila pilipes TaxID=299642 RepID=A0A8X6PQ06_NEPPI|nr:hypothetical protein NPIL_628271 [Nephila pilipes]